MYDGAEHSHGRSVTRRQAMGLAGAASAALLVARAGAPAGSSVAPADAEAATSCVLTPAKEEGPFFVDEKLKRSDIRVDTSTGTAAAGVPVTLNLVVVSADEDCAPVAGATIDIWNANAVGKYSDEAQEGTTGQKYLRGYQVTDAQGRATFVTNFPGWYSGRAVHVHAKIRLFDGSTQTYVFNTQLFFDPAVTSQVVASSAYSAHGSPDTVNSTDRVYGTDGSEVLVPLTADASTGGYTGSFTLGLSGLPSTTTTAPTTPTGTGTTTHHNVVHAKLSKARFHRTKTGRRVLHLAIVNTERVTVDAKLVRAGKTLAHKRVKGVKKGTHVLHVPVPAKVHGGGARLVLAFRDSAGKVKSTRRVLTVPRRASR